MKRNLSRIAILLIGFITFQSFNNSLIAQNINSDPSVFQLPIDDANAVYLQKGNFALHGNGVGDDAPALQAAIDMVEAQSKNGIVFVPEGTYRLGETIYLWRGVKLIGYGSTKPVFLLGENTPGFQEEDTKYMIHFCDRKHKEGEPINDAANTTMFSEMNNINIIIGKNNPSAIAIRFHVAQHCALKNLDINIGSARAGVEDIGNIIESCNFYGGDWGIKTGMTSPGWQAMVLDCKFSGQKVASIQTEEAGLTILRCGFKDAPKSILVPSSANERLFVKDCLFENISQFAIGVKNYFDPKTQVNLENLLFNNVPVSLMYYGGFGHGTSRTIPIPDIDINGVVSYPAPDKAYRINSYSHGLIIESDESTLTRKFNTLKDIEKLKVPGELPKKDYPALPAQNTWVNIRDLGAKGDGITDDTEIFKKAIKKHSVIYIPLGKYLLSETLILKEETALIGLHPSMTRFFLNPNTTGFSNTEKPAPIMITQTGGTNIISGIGFYIEENPGAIAVKWMAGSNSYMDDTFFSWSQKTNKGEGAFYGLWVTDGGGGTFKNLWAPNQQARNGLYVSNTTTEGRMYEISVEHHKEAEVKLENVSNWTFYNLQTEEDGGSEKSIAVVMDNCSNIQFNNNLSYRVKVMQTPAIAAFEINNSSNIEINGSHVFSWGTFPYDNTVYIKDRDVLIHHLDFTKFILK